MSCIIAIMKPTYFRLSFTLMLCIFIFQINAENTIYFTANKGQVVDFNNKQHPEILYTSSVKGADIYFRQNGFSYAIVEPNLSDDPHSENITSSKKGIHRIDMRFVNMSDEASLIASDQQTWYYNYYLGYLPDNIVHVPSYANLMLQNAYNNIDVNYYSTNGGELEYDIIVHKGANTSEIQLEWTGAEDAFIGSDGELILTTAFNELKEYMPKVYQNIDGKKIDVEANYRLQEGASAESFFVSFQIGEYNLEYDLIIDPWCTYMGGTGEDFGKAIVVDHEDNVLITGKTNSTAFPEKLGHQTSNAGSLDAFISKFDNKGNLLWSTYFGGSYIDEAEGLEVTSFNDLIIVGSTQKHSLNPADFPTLNAYQDTFGGGSNDIFLCRFSTNGVLQWSTYFGGSGSDVQSGMHIALNSNEDVVLSGETASSNFDTLNAYQSLYNGGRDVFLSSFTSNGNLTWSTYLGGSSFEHPYSLVIDKNDNIIIAGNTFSPDFDTLNSYIDTISGGSDVFISKFLSSGSLLWSTYLGGSGSDEFPDLAIDDSNNVLIAGSTWASDFPTFNAFQSTFGGVKDIFFGKFDSLGNPKWLSYLGGNTTDGGSVNDAQISVDDNNNIIISGLSASADFPTLNAFQPTLSPAPGADPFIAKFTSNQTLLWSTFIGGSGIEELNPTILGSDNAIHLMGDTYSESFPTLECSFEDSLRGGEDFFVVKVSTDGDLLCSSYIGGNGHDEAGENYNHYSMALNTQGLIHIMGIAAYHTGPSNGVPITPGAYQTIDKGDKDLIIAQLCPNTCGPSIITPNFSASDTVFNCSSGTNSAAFTDMTNLCDTSGVTWEWLFPGATPSVSTIQNPTGINYNSGTHDVTLIVNTPCGSDTMVKFDYISVTSDHPNLTLIEDTSLCIGSSIKLWATDGNSGSDYTWSPVNSLDNPNIDSPTASPTTDVTYEVIANNPCGSDTEYVNVNILPAPMISVQPADTTITLGNAVNLIALPDSLNYLWTPGNTLNDSSIYNPLALPNETTTYKVIATSSNGCSTEGQAIVRLVEEYEEFIFWIPNAFSPDGDGLNDLFIGQVMSGIYSFKTLELRIYDEIGNKIFVQQINSGTDKVSWDGTYKGSSVELGTYVWYVNVVFKDGDPINEDLQLSGNVTLLN